MESDTGECLELIPPKNNLSISTAVLFNAAYGITQHIFQVQLPYGTIINLRSYTCIGLVIWYSGCKIVSLQCKIFKGSTKVHAVRDQLRWASLRQNARAIFFVTVHPCCPAICVIHMSCYLTGGQCFGLGPFFGTNIE